MAWNVIQLYFSVGGQDKEHLSMQKDFLKGKAFYQDSFEEGKKYPEEVKWEGTYM